MTTKIVTFDGNNSIEKLEKLSHIKLNEEKERPHSRPSTARTVVARLRNGKLPILFSRPQTASSYNASSRPGTVLNYHEDLDDQSTKIHRVSPRMVRKLPTSLKRGPQIQIQINRDSMLRVRLKSPNSSQERQELETGTNRKESQNNLNTSSPLKNNFIRIPLDYGSPQEYPLPQFETQACESNTILVVNGHVLYTHISFQVFMKGLESFSWGSCLNMIYWIEKMSSDYCVPWAEISLKKVTKVLQLPFPWLKMKGKNDYISLVENRDDVEKILYNLGQKYKGNNRRLAAATKIQATWRMHIRRLHYIHWKDMLVAGKLFVKYYRMKLQRRWRLMMNQKNLENALEFMREQTTEFTENWKTKFEGKQRTVVMINSLGISEEARFEMQDQMESLQAFNYGRLLELADPLVSIILITPALTIESNLYFQKFINTHFNYANLLESGRLKIFEINRPFYVTKAYSLTSILLTQMNIVTQIKKLIGTKIAYLEPLVAGPEEARLAFLLKIPLFGGVDVASYLALNRVETRCFINNCNRSAMPGVEVHAKCILPLFHTKLRQIMKENPSYKRFVMKLNCYMNGKGLAYFDRVNFDSSIDENMELFPTILRFTSSHWETPDHYVKKFLCYGGIIEIVPDSNAHVFYPQVIVRVTPDGTINFVGSCDSLTWNPFENCGLVTPQKSPNQEEFRSMAYEMAQELHKGNYFGIVVCEFIAWKDSNQTDFQLKTLHVKPYYTTSWNYILISKYGCRSWDVWNDELNHVVPDEMQPKYANLKRLIFYDPAKYANRVTFSGTKERVCVYLWGLYHQNIPNLLHQAFESFCTKNNMMLHDDGTGCLLPVFHMNNTYPLTIVTINTSLIQTIRDILRNLVLLNRDLGLNTLNNFVDFAKLITNYLRLCEPDYEIIKNSILSTKSELELFVSLNLNDTKLFEPETSDNKLSTDEIQMSLETIQLLNMEIPSNVLKLDPHYGKAKTQSMTYRPNKIPHGTPLTKYLDLIEKQEYKVKLCENNNSLLFK